jgi:hypothetical protein
LRLLLLLLVFAVAASVDGALLLLLLLLLLLSATVNQLRVSATESVRNCGVFFSQLRVSATRRFSGRISCELREENLL